MARKKKEDGLKKVPHKFWVLPSYVPIIKQVIKNLDSSEAVTYLRPKAESEQKTKETPVAPKPDEPISKASFGTSVSDWVKNHNDEVVDVEQKMSEQKDYTAWQNDALMMDIYNACNWGFGGVNQEYPEHTVPYQRKYSTLWCRLGDAKRNNKTAICNEIMTEMMERINNE